VSLAVNLKFSKYFEKKIWKVLWKLSYCFFEVLTGFLF